MSSLIVRLEKLLRAGLTRAHRPGPVRRILIAHHLLLGDTLLLAPLLKALAARYPQAERVLLVRPAFLPLFAGRPYGVTAMAFARRDSATQREVLRSGPYELAFIPDDNRYAWLARAAGARWIVAFAGDRPAWKNWMVDEQRPFPDVPMAWADFAVSLASPDRVAGYRRSEWPTPPCSSFVAPRRPYVVLHVGASTPLKAWPVERWNALAATLRARGHSLVWSGAANERAWLAGIDAGEDELAWFGRLDLAQLWHLFAGALALVCPDTGIAHLGRLIGVPTLAMFGPGSAVIHGAGAFWAEAPFQAITRVDFPCRDQHRLYRREVPWVRRCGRALGIGADRCPEPLCMQAISVAEVESALDATLRAPS